jgi:hypothetical protein
VNGNETIALVLVGLLFSLSAGVRMTLPLIALNQFAEHHVIALPPNLSWMGDQGTLILLGVAFVAETLVHFVPIVGTSVKAISTPLAFAAGTLLMAVPLDHQNPLIQWTLAGMIGGGLATLTHVGLTGARTVSAPANLATGGMLGAGWNIGEIALALLLAGLGYLCLHVNWIVGVAILAAVFAGMALLAALLIKAWRRLTRLRPV